jgi:hypothetical protein
MEHAMRPFTAALVAILVIAVGAFAVLQRLQEPVSVAFATSEARVGSAD